MDGHFRGCAIDPCYCNLKRYWLVLAISIPILIAEIIGGVASGSLALLSDAAHVFQDILVVVITIVIERAIKRGANEAKLRSRSAYINAVFLFTVAAWIIWETIQRFSLGGQISSGILITVAAFGALGNYLQHQVLSASHSRDITHRGLSLHVLSDLWQSLAVILTGVLIALTGLTAFDLIISLIIALVFIFWSFKLWQAAGGTDNGSKAK